MPPAFKDLKDGASKRAGKVRGVLGRHLYS